MSEPVSIAAHSALAELLDVSPQVDAAVILEREGGRLIASAPSTADRMADRLGEISARLLDAAERSRNQLGREPVSQVEVATPDGHVFVVADGSWLVAAVTDADPTVGLVFYDLKTALRGLRDARVDEAGTATIEAGTDVDDDSIDPSIPTDAVRTAPIDDDAAADGAESDDASDSSEGSGSSAARWRRRKS